MIFGGCNLAALACFVICFALFPGKFLLLASLSPCTDRLYLGRGDFATRRSAQ
jgi:hypothetical protein